ncbi:MAG: cell division protein ZapE [Methylocystis sp.]
MSGSSPRLLARYDALAASGAIERDPSQLAALVTLERLAGELARPARAFRLPSFFRRRSNTRGVYLWGNIGRGKTTLMDLFFDAAGVEKKRRVHFHAFMAEIHQRLHKARREANGGSDPVSRVAAEFSRETRLLCFDEFAVSDIADATILARLFSALFSAGVVVVATSNVPPERLYEHGRNRDLFLPFIALLQERMEVVRLDARADFRLEKAGLGEVFFVAADPTARERLPAHMEDGPFAPATLRVAGRDIEIPRTRDGMARFDFAEICGRPLGAADYLALAKTFDTIVVDDVPAMTFDRRNEAKRFITLVDVLYEAKTRLILSARAEAEDLYHADQGDEAREFRRTVSRLVEMRSTDYLDAWAARRSRKQLEPTRVNAPRNTI